MKAIVTGMHGTVAPVLAESLRKAGQQVIPWDREVIPVDDENLIRKFLEKRRADSFFHLATGSSGWAELIARLCREYHIKLLFTSSVSVFSDSQSGPFSPADLPEPSDDYGKYKRECEQRMAGTCPEMIIARLGWQIGDSPGSNNMVDFLDRIMQEKGQIEASRNWYPSCSFLTDTANGLVQLMTRHGSGLYHVEGNPGLHFFDIINHLNLMQGKKWQIKPTDEPVLNNRMRDERIKITAITEHFADGEQAI